MHYTLTKLYQPISLLLLALTLCMPFQASADEMAALNEGQKAFNRGDFGLSFALWSTLATQGLADAQVFVGLSYENGWGTPRNAKLAEVWYQKAARNNNATGQYLLGLRYIQGTNIKRAKGLMWLQRAAANGDSSAQQFLKKGQTRGWFDGITPVTTPEPQPNSTTAEPQTLAFVD